MHNLVLKSDKEKAITYMSLSAQQNFPIALHSLAHMLQVSKADSKKFEEYQKKAANMGFFLAQHSYAVDLFRIYGRLQAKTSAHYFSLAIQQGLKESLFLLGVLYYAGIGVELDIEKGTKMMEEAVKCGVKTKQELQQVLDDLRRAVKD